MTIRVATCEKCGESSRFDTWPYDGGDEADSDELLEQMFLAEEWTYTADEELCPGCSGGDE